jgi:hypothetical protein
MNLSSKISIWCILVILITIILIFNNTKLSACITASHKKSVDNIVCAGPGEDVYDPKFKNDNKAVGCCDGQASIHNPDNVNQIICPKNKNPSKLPKEYIQEKTQRGKYTLKFIDNFETLNKDKWDVSSMGLDTLTNTCANYVKENVVVNNGELILKVGPNISDGSKCSGHEPGSNKKVKADSCVNSGRIVSKYSQKYGVFIFGAKIPKGKDLFPALWLVGTGDWPKTGEIDMMETILSTEKNSMFSSRLMIPIDSDFLGDRTSKNYYKSTSVPPDGSVPTQKKVDESFWDNYHTFALDWKKNTTTGDVTYDFYLDVKMSDNGNLIGFDGSTVSPYKSYSLKDLVNTYKNANNGYVLANYEDIRHNVSGQRMIMNVAVSSRDGSECGNKKCTACDKIDDEMNIQYVQIWE